MAGYTYPSFQKQSQDNLLSEKSIYNFFFKERDLFVQTYGHFSKAKQFNNTPGVKTCSCY